MFAWVAPVVAAVLRSSRLVYLQGLLIEVDPKTGTVTKQTQMLSPSSGLIDSLGCAFDPKTGTFYANAQGNGFFLCVPVCGVSACIGGWTVITVPTAC